MDAFVDFWGNNEFVLFFRENAFWFILAGFGLLILWGQLFSKDR